MNHPMFRLCAVAALLVLAVAGGPAAAQHSAADHAAHPPAAGAAASASPMSEGELRKVDRAAKRVTIQHGEIKNLGMPAMTMVFQVRDPALLAKAKEGAKVRFRAESDNGALVVTALEPAK